MNAPAMKYGHIMGQPVRYINGHYQRTTRLNAARRDRARKRRSLEVSSR
jgi:hypothetical protein